MRSGKYLPIVPSADEDEGAIWEGVVSSSLTALLHDEEVLVGIKASKSDTDGEEIAVLTESESQVDLRSKK